MTPTPDASTPLRVALLVNDNPVQPVIDEFGYYSDIYRRWLENSKPSKDVTFRLTPFDVFNDLERYPNPDEYDAIILTGSCTSDSGPACYNLGHTQLPPIAASAYSPLPWIERLKSYVRDVITSHPRVKLIGVCFGHQIIASAMGGTCIPNDGGWEIGVTKVLLTPTGKDIFGVENLGIQQMHRDHVPTVPPGFILLGSTAVSPIQGMVLPYPALDDGAVPSATETHILTVQGHPEFTGPIVEKIIDVRTKRGVIDAERAAKAREDAYKRHDGLGIIAQAIWKVMLNRLL